MATTDTHDAVPSEVRADDQAILEHLLSGKPLDPEIARRVHARAERVTDEVCKKHGVLDIGAAAIRELRDAQ